MRYALFNFLNYYSILVNLTNNRSFHLTQINDNNRNCVQNIVLKMLEEIYKTYFNTQMRIKDTNIILENEKEVSSLQQTLLFHKKFMLLAKIPLVHKTLLNIISNIKSEGQK